MTGHEFPTLFTSVVAELAEGGVKLITRPGEYVVNFSGGTEATAYVTDDLADAIMHGHALARSIAAAEPAAARPVRGKRRRRPLRMTPKAQRRRMIKKHNQRMRARALRQGDDQE